MYDTDQNYQYNFWLMCMFTSVVFFIVTILNQRCHVLKDVLGHNVEQNITHTYKWNYENRVC